MLVIVAGSTLSTFTLKKLFSAEGWALLTSSDVNEISQEGKKWGGGHGAFTWAVLEGLGGGADINRDRVDYRRAF
jgi:hypothetical protein